MSRLRDRHHWIRCGGCSRVHLIVVRQQRKLMSTGRRKNIRRHSKGNIKRHRSKKHLSINKEPAPKVSTHRDKSKAGSQLSHKPIAGPRLWLFRVIAVAVIPALLFLLLEITLRITGYGFPTNIAIKDKINAEPCYHNNTKFAWWFFHPNIARTTEPFSFSVNK